MSVVCLVLKTLYRDLQLVVTKGESLLLTMSSAAVI